MPLTPELQRAGGRKGALLVNGGSAAERAAVEAEIEKLRLDGVIDKIVAAAPRLTDDQRERLALILSAGE